MTQDGAPERILDAPVISEILSGASALFGVASGLLASGGPFAELLRQQSAREWRSQLLGVGEAMEARRRGTLTQEQWTSTLERMGFSAAAIGVLESLTPALLDAGTLVELLRREAIDDDGIRPLLARLGFTGEAADQLVSLRETLPPLQDVLRWAVREVFTPAIREQFQLDSDFPDAVLPFARRQGFSDENTRNAWAAHWELPSIQLAFEMLHRSPETGITEADLDLLLRAQDVMPFWREAIKAVAYRPFNRVDIRRMYKLGVLGDDELVQAYRDLGFDDARAEAQAEFARRLNDSEDDDALEPFRATLRSRVQSLYLRGAIGEDALRDAFSDLGHSPEQVDAFVAESTLIRETDRAEEVRQAVKRLYVRGFWDDDATITALRDAGFEADDIGNLLSTWSLDRELREETEAERAERDLTKSDVVGAFTDSLIERGEASSFLTDIGYDEAEADVLLDRAELRRTQDTRNRVESATRALLLAGRISPSEATGRLGGADIPQGRIDVLMAQWGDELDARAPELSVAQVQQALRRNLLDGADAAARLDAMGYTAEDRDILIELSKGATA